MITQFYTICYTRHIRIHNVFLTYTAPADFARRRWSPLGDSVLGEALSDTYFT
ncbi:hypothetical protein SAMN04487771_10141 [[Clostridium] aminophilum]|uniref:Uncharacterized protein n=1 Tax=[Clostridium] aminophilum TaxID=1526 RepID=A0A1I0DQU8_9FIRM|nr:hypothetical protein SAMN04487771_10141 [[Clostridium] aminophilum]